MNLVTNDSKIKDAVKWANAYFQSEDFEKDVLSIAKYEGANVSPNEILKLFQIFGNKEIEIRATYFGFFFKNVLGRTIGDGVAYLNTSGLYREEHELGGTVVHEVTHVVDDFFPEAEWGHGSNSAKGKERTFSYYIGLRASNWIHGEILKQKSTKLVMKRVQLREVYSW